MVKLSITASYTLDVPSDNNSLTVIPLLIEEAKKYPQGTVISAEVNGGKIHAMASDSAEAVFQHYCASKFQTMTRAQSRRRKRFT